MEADNDPPDQRTDDDAPSLRALMPEILGTWEAANYSPPDDYTIADTTFTYDSGGAAEYGSSGWNGTVAYAVKYNNTAGCIVIKLATNDPVWGYYKDKYYGYYYKNLTATTMNSGLAADTSYGSKYEYGPVYFNTLAEAKAGFTLANMTIYLTAAAPYKKVK
jgi:hypothetical protein